MYIPFTLIFVLSNFIPPLCCSLIRPTYLAPAQKSWYGNPEYKERLSCNHKDSTQPQGSVPSHFTPCCPGVFTFFPYFFFLEQRFISRFIKSRTFCVKETLRNLLLAEFIGAKKGYQVSVCSSRFTLGVPNLHT